MTLRVKHLSSYVFSKYFAIANITRQKSVILIHAVSFNNPGRKCCKSLSKNMTTMTARKKLPCVKTYLARACFFCVKYCDAIMSAVRNEKLFELIKICRK